MSKFIGHWPHIHRTGIGVRVALGGLLLLVVGAVEDRLEAHILALCDGQALDEQLLAALDAVLLAACLHDRVHVCLNLDSLA